MNLRECKPSLDWEVVLRDDSEVGEDARNLQVGDDVTGVGGVDYPTTLRCVSKASHLPIKQFRGASESSAVDFDRMYAVGSPVPIVPRYIALCRVRPTTVLVLVAYGPGRRSQPNVLHSIVVMGVVLGRERAEIGLISGVYDALESCYVVLAQPCRRASQGSTQGSLPNCLPGALPWSFLRAVLCGTESPIGGLSAPSLMDTICHQAPS